jgi:hypothetical protein
VEKPSCPKRCLLPGAREVLVSAQPELELRALEHQILSSVEAPQFLDFLLFSYVKLAIVPLTARPWSGGLRI